MTNYNDGNFHGWNGGECPVHPRTMVEYVCRDTLRDEDVAGNLVWDEADEECDPIIAFRVTKERKEPREWWISISSDGTQVLLPGDIKEFSQCEVGTVPGKIIHVREVMEGEE